MEYLIDRESEMLRNQKAYEKLMGKLFAVALEPGESAAKKFENLIDEDTKIVAHYFPKLVPWDENETPTADENQTPQDGADELQETTEDAAAVSHDTPPITSATSANGDDDGGVTIDATAWTAEIPDDGDDDDDDLDDPEDRDDENMAEEKEPDSES